jgi:hypothetical protein
VCAGFAVILPLAPFDEFIGGRQFVGNLRHIQPSRVGVRDRERLARYLLDAAQSTRDRLLQPRLQRAARHTDRLCGGSEPAVLSDGRDGG